jgi:hypothetical protein
MSLTKRILGQDIDRRITANQTPTKYGGDIDAMVRDWAQRTANTLKSNLAKKNINLTGELLESMTWRIEESESPAIVISFAQHGKFLDLKQATWSKSPPHDIILAWVKKKPLSSWAYVPGYEYKSTDGIPPGMSEESAQNRIAWGIMRSRQPGEVVNQFGKWGRKKQWQNPTASKKGKDNLNTAMSHLRHLLEDEIAAYAEGRIINIITQ